MNINNLKNFMFEKLELLATSNQKKAIKMRHAIAWCKRLEHQNPIMANTTFNSKPAISVTVSKNKRILGIMAKVFKGIAKMENDTLYIF